MSSITQRPIDGLVSVLASSKLDLIAERDALRDLAEHRGDDALTYQSLVHQALRHAHGLQRELARASNECKRLRNEKPDAARVIALERELSILREYAFALNDRIAFLEERLEEAVTE